MNLVYDLQGRQIANEKNFLLREINTADKNSIVVKSLSCTWLFATPWTAAHQASLPFIISQSLLKLISIESMILSNDLIRCRPFLLLSSIFPSIRVF